MLKPLVAATLMIGIGLQVEGAAQPQFGFLTDLFRPLKVRLSGAFYVSWILPFKFANLFTYCYVRFQKLLILSNYLSLQFFLQITLKC